jgi:tRNA (guanine10-N2)-dimethyltransferase
MQVGFLLSKEHEKLPYAELNALLEVCIRYNMNSKAFDKKVFDNYVVIRNEGNGLNVEKIREINKRSAYINESHEIVFEMLFNENKEYINNINLFYKKLKDLKLDKYISKHDSFAVRVIKIPKEINQKKAKIDDTIKKIKINSMDIERTVGAIVKNKTNAKVNLKNPSKVVKVVILNDRIYLALLIEERNKEYFQKNRPHLRTYFHPGCILPKLARCMVNLARLKEKDVLFDPFCGTGGFLIEGGFIGCRLIGSDIDNRMVEGTLMNLKSYNLDNKIISLKQWDARDVENYLKSLNIEKVDGIVTDPPYGISTSAKGDVESILNNLSNTLKPNGYLIFASPRRVNLDNLILKEVYEIYIHKNLTRYVHVYRNDE